MTIGQGWEDIMSKENARPFNPRQDPKKPTLPPIRRDELAVALRDFKAKSAEVQRRPPGYADGAIVTPYGKLLRS